MLVRLNDDPKVASEVDLKASYLGMGGGNSLRPPLAMSLACIVMASQLTSNASARSGSYISE